MIKGWMCKWRALNALKLWLNVSGVQLQFEVTYMFVCTIITVARIIKFHYGLINRHLKIS